jgi:HlyD family secretion protein
LAGCAQATPAPIPTLAVTPSSGATQAVTAAAAAPSGSVTASAEIVPLQSIDLGFVGYGQIGEVKVAEGDVVKAGDLLASQDNLAQLQAALAASQAALDSAQKSYDNLVANAPQAKADAELAVLKAQKAVDDAQKAVKSKQFQRASQQTIDIARANLIVAKKALDDAQTIYDQNKARSSEDVNYAAALAQLASAQQKELQAQYNFDYVSALPDPLDVQTAQANLDVAQGNLQAANLAWSQVKDGLAGPEFVAAQSQLSAAQAALAAAQTAVGHAQITAPFSGTVVAVNVSTGQIVNPGQVALTLADLSALQAQTTDLSERDIQRVSLGQTATVSVTGVEKQLTGKVTQIARRATKLGGDTVYQVTIRLDHPDAGLRWGMSATVQIGG